MAAAQCLFVDHVSGERRQARSYSKWAIQAKGNESVLPEAASVQADEHNVPSTATIG